MMKNIHKIFRSIIIAFLLLLTSTGSYASHILGMDLYYTWVSGNTYKITAILYGDCSPSSYTAFSTLPSSSPQICIYRGSTYITTIGLTIQAPTAGVDITPVCPADVGHTQCENMSSTIPGIKKFVYSANYTLPAPVTSNCWQFLYIGYDGYGSAAGRSANITNLANASATSIELVDTLDNSVYPNNSNTQFSVIPTPFFCINSPDTYNPGAVNPIDSFQIDLVAAMNSAYIYSGCAYGTPCTYTGTAWTPPATPVSPTTPLRVTAGTYSYNSSTGQLNFTPNAAQRSTVVYNVREYRHGTTTYVGSCQREMNFLVQTCTHTAPHGAIDSTAGGTLTDSVHFTICQNSGPFNLYFDPREPGSTNTITITSSGLPTGASLTVVGNGTTTPHGTFAWTSNGVAPGTYIFYVTYTDNNCPLTGTTTQAITVIVTPAPTVAYTVVSPATCYAKEVITITPGGTGSPWNINVTGGTTQTFTGVTGSFTDSLSPGTYTLAIVSAAGSTCNSSIPVTVAGPIIITIAVTNPTVCAPANGSFTVSGLTAGQAYTIYYTLGGTPVSAVMTANASGQITVAGLAPGSYTNVYAVSNVTGCSSNILTFTMVSITVTITGNFTNPTVCAPPNGSIVLSGLTAGGGYTVYYTENGTAVNAVVTANASGQIVLTGLPSGSYTNVYVVSTASGCQSNILTFTLVNPADPLPPTLTGPTVCADSVLRLTATDASTGIVYSWSGPNSFATTIQNPSISNAQTNASGVYLVTVTNTTTGCTSSNTLTVNVKPTPVIPVITGNNPCQGAVFNLSATSTAGSTYAWSGPASFVSALQSPNINPATPVNTGTYTVVATLNGCPSLPGTANFVIYPTPPPPVAADSTYCQMATTAPLSAAGSNLLWYTSATGGTGSAAAPIPSDTAVGTTTWYVSQTINGCESPRAPINVNVLYLPVFNITGNTKLCEGASTTLYYSGPAVSSPSYLWTLPIGASVLSGSLVTDSILVKFDSVANQNVTLTVADYGGKCSTTEVIPITVVEPPLSHFYIKPDICIGDTVLLALDHITPSATVFNWNFDGATIIAANSNSGGPYSLSWYDTGLHIVSLVTSTDIGCTTPPVYDSFKVHGLPDAQIAPPKQDICLEDTLVLSAMVEVYNNHYEWAPAHFFDFDNKPLSNNNSTVRGIIQVAGDVTLTVTDPFGCVASSNVYFDPDPCCTLVFPNAFTPNGDGRNDFFRPILKGVHTFHIFQIVNRWGQLVFETTNTNGAWDGTFNGVPQDMGVYFYFLKYDCAGKTLEAKGDVTLIR